MSDAIRAAQDAATEAVHVALKAMVEAKEPMGSKRTARIIASQAFSAMVIPAEYVAGYRDAQAKVRQAIGPALRDQWLPAADAEPGFNPHVTVLPGGGDTLDWIGPAR